MRVLFVAQQIDYEPQGIMHLSSALKAAGHQVALAVEAHEDPVAVAREFRPAIVGYSVITGSQRYYLELNRRIRQEIDVFSVFGGPHPTFFPEMIEVEGVDGICIGEGEGAIVDLANALDDGGSAGLQTPLARNELRYSSIPNWHFKLNGEILRNAVRPYVDDLDSLPLPDRDLVYRKDRTYQRSKIKHFIAGRGCPYNCTYCFNHALSEIYRGKGRRFRMRSVDHVIEEVCQVKAKYPLEFVVFVDDVFVLSESWLVEFAKKYPREIGLPFFCNTRANLVTAEQVQLLKKAGCTSVSMGIEAADDRLRNELLKRKMSKEQILQAARLLREGGIHFTTTNMIGLPTSTLEDDFQTLALNIECQPAYAHAFIFQPYPRTELGEFTRQHGWMVGTFDDIGEVAWDTSVLNFSPEHKRQLTNLQRFFALAVEWPWLLPLVRRLIRLPGNSLFWLVNKLWKGYAIKRRVHPVRLSLREYVDMAWHFMKIKS
jgi:anaerobic magnesium-protoporphyrin IX monomethyl ester cyclase